MKEHPILFSGQMVRTILSGAKTQTRRVMSPQPAYEGQPVTQISPLLEGQDCHKTGEFMMHHPQYDRVVRSGLWCPYGKPGDRLWVRETHCIVSVDGGYVNVAYAERMPPGKTLAQTDGGVDCIPVYDGDQIEWAEKRVDCERWRPSIFMPRWASRITLEITDVRVERVTEISEEDARAEGVDAWLPSIPELVQYASPGGSFRNGFHSLWESINSKRPGCAWAANPWVWCVSFRRIAQ